MLILTECNLAKLVAELLSGKTVIFPTETSYGLGCDATNQRAADAIFQIKGRPNDKPLLAVVPNIEMAKKYLVWNERLETIAKKYWPGAVTVVGEYNAESAGDLGLARGVVGGDNTVAVRVTTHPLLKSITEMMGRPLVATSANLADAGNVYNPFDIIAMFEHREHQPDIVLNHGELRERPSSTLVSVVGGELKVLRQGEVTVEV